MMVTPPPTVSSASREVVIDREWLVRRGTTPSSVTSGYRVATPLLKHVEGVMHRRVGAGFYCDAADIAKFGIPKTKSTPRRPLHTYAPSAVRRLWPSTPQPPNVVVQHQPCPSMLPQPVYVYPNENTVHDDNVGQQPHKRARYM